MIRVGFAPAVDKGAATKLSQGQQLAADAAWPVGRTAIFGPDGELMAVGTVTEDGKLRPERVFLR